MLVHGGHLLSSLVAVYLSSVHNKNVERTKTAANSEAAHVFGLGVK